MSGLRMGAGAAGRCSRCPSFWPGSARHPKRAGLPPAVVTRWPPASAESRAGLALLSPRQPASGSGDDFLAPLPSFASALLEPCGLSFGCFLYSCRGRALRERSGCYPLCSALGVRAGKVQCRPPPRAPSAVSVFASCHYGF